MFPQRGTAVDTDAAMWESARKWKPTGLYHPVNIIRTVRCCSLLNRA
jgi:hypothetical protein